MSEPTLKEFDPGYCNPTLFSNSFDRMKELLDLQNGSELTISIKALGAGFEVVIKSCSGKSGIKLEMELDHENFNTEVMKQLNRMLSAFHEKQLEIMSEDHPINFKRWLKRNPDYQSSRP